MCVCMWVGACAPLCVCSVIQSYLCGLVGVRIDVGEYKEYISVNLGGAGKGMDMCIYSEI